MHCRFFKNFKNYFVSNGKGHFPFPFFFLMCLPDICRDPQKSPRIGSRGIGEKISRNPLWGSPQRSRKISPKKRKLKYNVIYSFQRGGKKNSWELCISCNQYSFMFFLLPFPQGSPGISGNPLASLGALCGSFEMSGDLLEMSGDPLKSPSDEKGGKRQSLPLHILKDEQEICQAFF